jgi:hypothetical protein
MKITKTQLQRIIKEELNRVLKEMAPRGSLHGAAAILDHPDLGLSDEEKVTLGKILGDRAEKGEFLSDDPVQALRQANYWVTVLRRRGKLGIDPTDVDPHEK